MVECWDDDTEVTDVTEIPMRPPAVHVVHDKRMPTDGDAVPRYVSREDTRPIGSPNMPVRLLMTSWGE